MSVEKLQFILRSGFPRDVIELLNQVVARGNRPWYFKIDTESLEAQIKEMSNGYWVHHEF